MSGHLKTNHTPMHAHVHMHTHNKNNNSNKNNNFKWGLKKLLSFQHLKKSMAFPKSIIKSLHNITSSSMAGI